ncbi:TetR/AcrR family transcriptional regulator [Thermobifida halotolerans]|uniref:TetR/AcrR family transcriptional regulator n=1 Tax=Thermobifida halotolerans TaxID=483545 RepID=A0A399G6N5_9ACTN|nr:TetR/AcrR family transcriptional regulator [Thermobifida halotolerans]UOE20718.1 TetR/AcrR family transcriptional regulator [Thermobifida halotolerans]
MPLQFGPSEPFYKGQVTRRRILDALHDLLRTSPAAQVSMADVAERAGMKRPSVYNHFRTVDDMCLALIDRSISTVFDGFRTEGASDLGSYIRSVLLNTFRMWTLHHVVFVMALEVYARDRAFARAWDDRIARDGTDRALLVYQADVDAGRLSPLPDPRGILEYINFSVQHQLHRLWRNGVPTVEESCRELELCATVIWRLLGLPGEPVVDRDEVAEALAQAQA